MESIATKQSKAFDAMKGTFGYTNKMAAPKIQKVVVSVGTGKKIKGDKKANEFIAGRLAAITGQKAAIRGAKKSIATYKTRIGDPIGLVVTLRGKKMQAFLDKLVNIALPRTKDFRGSNRSSVDKMGNMTLGIKEHTIFPETADEDLKDVFGMAVNVTTTAKTRDEALAFFEHLGFPLKKTDEAKKRRTRRKK